MKQFFDKIFVKLEVWKELINVIAMQGRRARVEQALLTCCQIVQRRQGELFLFGSSVWSFAPGDIDLVVSGFRVEDQKDTERELRESTSFPLDIFWANRVPHLLEYKTGM